MSQPQRPWQAQARDLPGSLRAPDFLEPGREGLGWVRPGAPEAPDAVVGALAQGPTWCWLRPQAQQRSCTEGSGLALRTPLLSWCSLLPSPPLFLRGTCHGKNSCVSRDLIPPPTGVQPPSGPWEMVRLLLGSRQSFLHENENLVF